jgi:hypothetical protein
MELLLSGSKNSDTFTIHRIHFALVEGKMNGGESESTLLPQARNHFNTIVLSNGTSMVC